MDARGFNGDDEREFGIDPDEESCEDCGAGPLEDCAWWCQCLACETGRAVLKEKRA
jgi:hypothetical protein